MIMGMTIEMPQVSDTAKLSAKDVAELLGISKRTVLSHIQTGLLKATFITRVTKNKDGETKITYSKYRISGKDLKKYWNQY